MKHGVEKNVLKTINELELEQITNIDTVNLITLEEVRLQIKKLKNNKAPGFDGILNIFLKKLPDIALEFLRNILNACLKFGYFPHIFKCAKVVAIHKRGKDPRLPSSYRPISLLSCVDKIFEKIILSRMNIHIENNGLINKEQFVYGMMG